MEAKQAEISKARLPMLRDFPFNAVIGQDAFKLALILVAINPAIGGVVISGPRGSAKSTLARGLADLLPANTLTASRDTLVGEVCSSHANFVTLPLGASEEMLLGTLNLEQVLNDKQLAFSPGLLSKAHGGVLYVDEVNLLPDNLVDLLLDVSASGVNRVERDGISHAHQAKFLLLGTMNPDEGELRPQLHDRFGLSVELTNQYSAEERVAIVKARESFDRHPEAYCEHFAAQQAQTLDKIVKARAALDLVSCPDAIRMAIADRCAQAQVDGLRADIVWYRAALAHAAWAQRAEISLEDVLAVETLVLAHRRRAGNDSGGKNDSGDKNDSKGKAEGNSASLSNQSRQNFKRPNESQKSTPHNPSSGHGGLDSGESGSGDSDSGSSGGGDWGSMAPQSRTAIEKQAFVVASTQVQTQTGCSVLARVREQHFARAKGVGAKGTRRGLTLNNRPDWFKTLLNNMAVWPPSRLRYQTQKQGMVVLNLVIFDTSASTLKSGVLEAAKGAVMQIAQDAYLKREHLAVLGFGNDNVAELMARVRAPKDIETWLHGIKAGGGTPLVKALADAKGYAVSQLKKSPALRLRTFVISDGRTTAQLNAAKFPGELVWLDTESSTVARGRGRLFAEQLGGLYLSLRELSLTQLSSTQKGLLV